VCRERRERSERGARGTYVARTLALRLVFVTLVLLESWLLAPLLKLSALRAPDEEPLAEELELLGVLSLLVPEVPELSASPSLLPPEPFSSPSPSSRSLGVTTSRCEDDG